MYIDGEEEIKYVSGTIYSYSFLCMRKVWLSFHNLSMEQESELVEVGKLIDETTYKNERHNFMIDNIVNIDFLKKNIKKEKYLIIDFLSEIYPSEDMTHKSPDELVDYMNELITAGKTLKVSW